MFNPLEHPVALLLPERQTQLSGWTEHIPFAMALVDLLRPSTIVELGTYAGDSYCAMCQAVQHLDLDTRCYAVDTWVGDPQTGFYGGEILEGLRQHHDPRYGRFSQLIVSTFEDALHTFGDGTIDLLHIDGFHGYDEAKRDLDTWLPKVSPAGVVLLHDIHERVKGFGVWRLWEELRKQCRHFEFHHGHGLGLLAAGPDSPPALETLLQAGQEEARSIRKHFFALGHRLTLGLRAEAFRTEAATVRAREIVEIGARLSEEVEKISAAAAVTAASQRHIDDALATTKARQTRLDEVEHQVPLLEQEVQKRDAQIEEMDAAVRSKNDQIDALHHEIALRDARCAELERTVAARDGRIAELETDPKPAGDSGDDRIGAADVAERSDQIG